MPDVDQVPFWFLKIVALALGASLGSFANVLVHRIPRGLNIARPGSACPHCGYRIRWYDNVPILSWVLLRGRCRKCGAPISLRYPLIELAVAVLSLACLYLAVMRTMGTNPSLGGVAALWFFPFAFCFLLVTLTFVDLEHWRIPHVFTITGTVLGVLWAVAAGPLTGVTWVDSLIGIVAGAVPLAILIEVYFRLTGREGMGYGDVMLLGMIGANLGYVALPFVLLAASLQGLLVAVPMTLAGRNKPPPWESGEEADSVAADATPGDAAGSDSASTGVAPADADAAPAEAPSVASGDLRHAAIPFGPFLALGALEWLFFGDAIRAIILP